MGGLPGQTRRLNAARSSLRCHKSHFASLVRKTLSLRTFMSGAKIASKTHIEVETYQGNLLQKTMSRTTVTAQVTAHAIKNDLVSGVVIQIDRNCKSSPLATNERGHVNQKLDDPSLLDTRNLRLPDTAAHTLNSVPRTKSGRVTWASLVRPT